ncbi:serine hydrolase domain-containing protein [Mucilaginibacter ginsenosidivorans]|uniref:Beta-lactamase family protein n=1 Tax=Mucilaginibacter ginsenosidivorans TaxID=398053 RepID=A0A5B8UWZ5_9SPHI|nr:serine hydrolase domain-containing protein [Mucilaginibacter ginsenosidivorans]QEC63459.1 beta-lactamase family protein [Mucilaginibacter ginsenosidivorans]
MKRQHSFILLVFVFFVSVRAVDAQTYKPPVFTDADRLKKIEETFPVIDKLYKEYAEQNHFPGLVYGIIADGKLVHAGGIGYTSIADKTEATSKSDFRIASMSKSFTAMAILKLRDEGKLRLDDPISLYIPEAKNMKRLTKDAPAITIRHLLTHSAGFPEDNPWGDRQLANTDQQLTDLYKKGVSFSNDPGLGYEYSNLGFATLGYIIKKVSGKTYEQYITDNILKPLGMNHTYWEYTKAPKQLLAHGYRWLDGKWVEQPMLHDGSYGAMGGMITTIEDFAKYEAFHLSAWPPRDAAEMGPVKRSSVREMQYPWDINGFNVNYKTATGRSYPFASAYCYGLRWRKYIDGMTAVGHTGGLPGFGSEWTIYPEYGIGVVCFANLTYANTGTVNLQVADTLIRLSGIKMRQLPPSDILIKRKDQLIKLLPGWDNAKASGIFAINFFMDYFPDKLKAEATAIFEKAGNITSVGEVVPENQLRGYFIMKGEQANIKVSFTLTPENPALIQEYHIALVK